MLACYGRCHAGAVGPLESLSARTIGSPFL
jgi:hypothetical protein